METLRRVNIANWLMRWQRASIRGQSVHSLEHVLPPANNTQGPEKAWERVGGERGEGQREGFLEIVNECDMCGPPKTNVQNKAMAIAGMGISPISEMAPKKDDVLRVPIQIVFVYLRCL